MNGDGELTPALRALWNWRWGIDARVAGVMELEMGVYARNAGVMELEMGNRQILEKIGIYDYEMVGYVIMNMKRLVI